MSLILQFNMTIIWKKPKTLPTSTWPQRLMWNLLSILVVRQKWDEDFSLKWIRKLEKSLEESWESHMKVEDGLHVTRQENPDLSKKLAKMLQKNFFVAKYTFVCALEKVY